MPLNCQYIWMKIHIYLIDPPNFVSSAVIDRLRCTLSIHGVPYFIFSDRGPSLASQEFNIF